MPAPEQQQPGQPPWFVDAIRNFREINIQILQSPDQRLAEHEARKERMELMGWEFPPEPKIHSHSMATLGAKEFNAYYYGTFPLAEEIPSLLGSPYDRTRETPKNRRRPWL